jgi:hypothetical protein
MMGLLGAGCPVETFENSENARRKALVAFRGLDGRDRARSLGVQGCGQKEDARMQIDGISYDFFKVAVRPKKPTYYFK